MTKHFDSEFNELKEGKYLMADGKTKIYFTGKYDDANFAVIKNENDMEQGLALCVIKTLKKVE